MGSFQLGRQRSFLERLSKMKLCRKLLTKFGSIQGSINYLNGNRKNLFNPTIDLLESDLPDGPVGLDFCQPTIKSPIQNILSESVIEENDLKLAAFVAQEAVRKLEHE